MRLEVRIISNKIPRLNPIAKLAAQRAATASAKRVVKKAQARAKVDTGRMRASTVVRNEGGGHAEAYAGAPYSGFLDRGTRYIPADRWFSGPALEERVLFGNDFAHLVILGMGAL